TRERHAAREREAACAIAGERGAGLRREQAREQDLSVGRNQPRHRGGERFERIEQDIGVRRARAPVAGACDMAVIFDFGVQGAQMLLVLLLAPLLTGFTRKVKARLLLRRGPPLVQPYRDLVRLMRKEVVLADNASWL